MRRETEAYRVVCISMYNGDLERCDEMVDELKYRGFTSANRSALVRYALRQLDVKTIPKPPISGRLDDAHPDVQQCPACASHLTSLSDKLQQYEQKLYQAIRDTPAREKLACPADNNARSTRSTASSPALVVMSRGCAPVGPRGTAR